LDYFQLWNALWRHQLPLRTSNENSSVHKDEINVVSRVAERQFPNM
jgi:hypothetical protein